MASSVRRRQLGPFAVRSTEILIAEGGEEHHTLRRSVGALDLTAMGVGAIIGTGIFVVIGEGAGDGRPGGRSCRSCWRPWPALFSALSYAELASSIPVSGSAYTYTYATLGEIVAWIIGWDLILEYGVSVAAIAVGWGGNLNAFLDSAFGVEIPRRDRHVAGGRRRLQPAGRLSSCWPITALLVRGARESARVNLVMVVHQARRR